MIRRPPRSTRTHTLSLHVALPFSVPAGMAQRPARTGAARPLAAAYRNLAVQYHCLERAGAARTESSAVRAHVHSGRSEEHTSELQSLMRISYAVFCLKKKN